MMVWLTGYRVNVLTRPRNVAAMFPLKIVLANVLVPMVVASVSILTAKLSGRSGVERIEDDSQVVSRKGQPLRDALIGAVAAVLAIWLAFGLRNGFAFYPEEDAWMRIPFATLLVAISVLLTAPLHGLWRWAIRLGFAAFASWTVFPTGEAWEFLLTSRFYWIAALTISSLIGWLGIETRSPRASGILALAWIPCFAASAFLTAQSFMKVTEPLLAVSSVVGCFGLAAIVSRRSELIHNAAGPCLMASVAAIANAQFNSYLGLSDLLSGLAMFAPAIVALASFPFVSRRESPTAAAFSGVMGIMVTLSASLIVSAAIVVWTQIASGGGEEQW